MLAAVLYRLLTHTSTLRSVSYYVLSWAGQYIRFCAGRLGQVVYTASWIGRNLEHTIEVEFGCGKQWGYFFILLSTKTYGVIVVLLEQDRFVTTIFRSKSFFSFFKLP